MRRENDSDFEEIFEDIPYTDETYMETEDDKEPEGYDAWLEFLACG